MKKKIVFRIIGLLLILLPFSCTFYLLEYKFYYTVEDVTFTFWNTSNGCYIMPYKYTGLLFPKDNYMIVSPLDYIDITYSSQIKGSSHNLIMNIIYQYPCELFNKNESCVKQKELN